jgi:hypothetical protein
MCYLCHYKLSNETITKQLLEALIKKNFHEWNTKTINHLILLKMDKSLRITPQLQLGHNNLTIRLYELASASAIHDRTIDMEIAFCQI